MVMFQIVWVQKNVPQYWHSVCYLFMFYIKSFNLSQAIKLDNHIRYIIHKWTLHDFKKQTNNTNMNINEFSALWSPLTEPWPGYRRQHTEGSLAASTLWLTDLKHGLQEDSHCDQNRNKGLHHIVFKSAS